MASRTVSALAAPRELSPRAQALTAALGRHRVALASLLLIAAVYVAALALLPPQALTHHDEGAKYLQVRNLRITPAGLDWSINYPARRLDPNLEWVPFNPKQHYIDSQGRIYLQWPIFLGLLTRIFWKMLGFWGLYVVPLLAGLGTLWASYRLALASGVPSRLAWLAIPLVGLTTPIPIYSLLYFEHTLASLLVVLSITAGMSAINGDIIRTPHSALRTPQLVSGVLLALAVYFRSELYVLAVVMLAALAFISFRRGEGLRLPLAWGIGFGLALVPLWGFYAVTEGNLLPAHALWYFASSDPSTGAVGGLPKPGLPPLRYIATAGWGVIPAFLLGPDNAPLAPRYSTRVEWASLAGVTLCGLSALAPLVRGRLQSLRLPTLGLGLLLILVSSAELLFSSQEYYNLHGFLLASPVAALVLWPPRSGEPGRFLYMVSLLYVGLHALIISALSGLGPISLHEWGQRYILPAYPLLMVLALLTLSRLSQESIAQRVQMRWAFPVLFGLLALVGFGFAARGYAMLSDERAQVSDWLGLVRTLPPGEPVVTDVWWLPLNLAADFYSRPFMLAEGDASLGRWASEMKSRGVSRFGFATTDPSIFEGTWAKQVPGISPVGPPREVRGLWVQDFRLAGAP